MGQKILIKKIILYCLFSVFSILYPLSSTLYSYEAVLVKEDIEGTLENTKLNEVFNQYLATIQMYDPERATMLGIHDADSILTQRTRENLELQTDVFKKLRSKLHEIKKVTLYASLQIDYDLLDMMLEVDIFNLENVDILKKRPQHYLTPLFSAYLLLSKDFGSYTLRAANALARLRQFPDILLQAERNLSRPPRIWAEHAIKQTDDAVESVSEFIPLFRAYVRYDPVLKTQVDDVINTVKSALKRYSDFLRNEILPNADGDFRVGDYIYGFYLERWHGLDETVNSIHRYSRKAFKRSLEEIQKEAENIDPLTARTKGWKEVLKNLPQDVPPIDGVLTAFQDEIDRAYQHFDQYKVVEFPRERIIIKQMPLFLSSVLPYASYIPPFPLDDKKIADLLISVPSPKLSKEVQKAILSANFNDAKVELLAAYLVMPGMHLHSFQMAKNPSRIRAISYQPMVTNGWACYSEYLAGQQGFYSTYWSGFLRVYTKLIRSLRAYIDSGLHLKKISYEQAVALIQEELGFSKNAAEQEVLKISLTPTEGITWMLGMERILQMRRHYERTEEKYADLRKFHTEFLRIGSIPINSIDSELRRRMKESERIIK